MKKYFLSFAALALIAGTTISCDKDEPKAPTEKPKPKPGEKEDKPGEKEDKPGNEESKPGEGKPEEGKPGEGKPEEGQTPPAEEKVIGTITEGSNTFNLTKGQLLVAARDNQIAALEITIDGKKEIVTRWFYVVHDTENLQGSKNAYGVIFHVITGKNAQGEPTLKLPDGQNHKEVISFVLKTNGQETQQAQLAQAQTTLKINAISKPESEGAPIKGNNDFVATTVLQGKTYVTKAKFNSEGLIGLPINNSQNAQANMQKLLSSQDNFTSIKTLKLN